MMHIETDYLKRLCLTDLHKVFFTLQKMKRVLGEYKGETSELEPIEKQLQGLYKGISKLIDKQNDELILEWIEKLE